jgi:putative salt-induced outer membrane protein YdiY
VAAGQTETSEPATPPDVTPAVMTATVPAKVAADETAATASVAPVVAPVVAAPAAPPVVPVFYPWSGLKTEQDTFDWIQLKSGEWLKGKINSFYEETLEFDSEKMDLREFDWEDVIMVRSPRLNSLRFEKSGKADGSLLINATEVRVVSDDGTTTYPRAELLAITPTGRRERNHWSGKLSAGLNLRSGNTAETKYNVQATLNRRTPETRLSLDYLGNYTHTNGKTSEENQRFTATFDYFLSRKLYVRLPDAEYYRDPLQNIESRYTLGTGIGYDLISKNRLKWDVAVGPAYQVTKYTSVEAGQEGEEQSTALVLGTHVEVELTKQLDWILDYRGQFAKEGAGGAIQHANSTLEFEIHKRLTLDLSFIWDGVSNPKTGADGVTPVPNDYRLITSLGIDF